MSRAEYEGRRYPKKNKIIIIIIIIIMIVIRAA